MFKGSLFKICLQAALMSTILTIIVLMCFYFISTMNQHKHSYDTTEVVNPTCTVGGYTKHICSCGETYVDSNTAPLGHSFDSDTGFCTVCQQECAHRWSAGEEGDDEAGHYVEYVCKYCDMHKKEYED